jgi:hypothetical protein
MLESRLVVANTAAAPVSPLSHVVLTAANISPIGEEDWQLLAPYGDHPHPVGLQRLTKAHAQEIVQSFNSVAGRLGRFFRGVPIYVGHPDVDPDTYKDDRRFGKVEAVEAREDGLWVKTAWNDLGKSNQSQGYWIYPSGVFSCRVSKTPGVIEPCELISVGLTNRPNIRGVRPWAANAGTREGALKGWETRRRNGAAGKVNKKAEAAKGRARTKRMSKEDKAVQKAIQDHALRNMGDSSADYRNDPAYQKAVEAVRQKMSGSMDRAIAKRAAQKKAPPAPKLTSVAREAVAPGATFKPARDGGWWTTGSDGSRLKITAQGVPDWKRSAAANRAAMRKSGRERAAAYHAQTKKTAAPKAAVDWAAEGRKRDAQWAKKNDPAWRRRMAALTRAERAMDRGKPVPLSVIRATKQF